MYQFLSTTVADTGPTDVYRDDTITIVHVDDEAAFAEMAAEYLEREREAFNVKTVTDARALADRDADNFAAIDCIVSDYNMPEMNGLELLEAIRERSGSLPFILYTGKGSEEIASEAISQGVTDYLQKESGTDQFTVLANRIANAVQQYRAEEAIERTNRWYSTILEHSSDYMLIVDGMGTAQYVSPSVRRVLGYEPEEVTGLSAFEWIHPDDVEHAVSTLSEVVEHPEEEPTVEFRAKHKDGSWRWLEVRGRSLLKDPLIDGVMVNARDITERKERERDLKSEKERLEKLTSFISHDVRSQLMIIGGQLNLAQKAASDSIAEHLEVARESTDRIDEMIDKMVKLAEGEAEEESTREIELEPLAQSVWLQVRSDGATFNLDEVGTLEANEERLRALLENLMLNAIEHGGPDVTVWMGELTDENGFYVADDGPGIPPEQREEVLEWGYSTGEDGTGLGLTIVDEIAHQHGWELEITDGPDGGTRFEIVTGNDLTPTSA